MHARKAKRTTREAGRLRLPAVAIEEQLDSCRIRGAARGPCRFDESAPTNHPHVHASYELCIVFAGSGSLSQGNAVVKVGPGDVFLTDPGVLHEISSFDALDLVFFMFELIATPDVDAAPRRHAASFEASHASYARNQFHLIDLLRAINSRMMSPGNGYWLRRMTSQLLIESLESLASRSLVQSESDRVTPDRTLDLAVNYIRAHSRSRIRLDDLADAVGASARKLQLLFRRHFDSTVTEFINTERMRVAANDLLMGYRAQEVAYRVGINSPEQFSRLFKKHHGIPPKRYQLEYAPGPGGRKATFQLHRKPKEESHATRRAGRRSG